MSLTIGIALKTFAYSLAACLIVYMHYLTDTHSEVLVVHNYMDERTEDEEGDSPSPDPSVGL